MKRILIILLLTGMSINLNAYSVKYKTKKKSDGSYSYVINCNNGTIKDIYVYPNKTTPYFDGLGHSFTTLNGAVNSKCKSSKSKIINIKNGAMVCSTRKRMKEVLKDDSMYSLVEMSLSGGCRAVHSGKAKVLKTYRNDTYVGMYKNKKRTWKLIDTYYKIKAGRTVSYIRKAATY